jgi:hypothetical protein
MDEEMERKWVGRDVWGCGEERDYCWRWAGRDRDER